MYTSPTRRNLRARASLPLLTLMLVAIPALAQQKPLPIHIESDNADFSQQSGKSTYAGDVVLTRGGLTLSGDKLTITRMNDRGNVRAVLDGSPAHLDKQPDREGDDVVTGHSDHIEYTNDDSTVVLRGDAVVERSGDRITGQLIRHNLDTERTQAEHGSGGNGRVRITIQPDNGDKP